VERRVSINLTHWQAAHWTPKTPTGHWAALRVQVEHIKRAHSVQCSWKRVILFYFILLFSRPVREQTSRRRLGSTRGVTFA